MLRSKLSNKMLKNTASRQFTDREEPRNSFRKAFKTLSDDQYKVLIFYGVGGIGKSRLLKELYSLTSSIDASTIKVSIDFREQKHRDPSEALIWLRQQLTKEYQIKFTTFDLAYAVYFSRMKSQLTLKSERKSLPFLEEGNFVGELINELENIPVAQWIPKTLKLIDGFARYKEILQWWNRTGKGILTDLKDMHPKDIEEMLVVYWAADLREYMKRSNQKAVFFFDTYEALWEYDRSIGSFSDRDEWIREFILQFEDVSVLNVICGREKITWGEEEPEWNQVVDQHLIGELSPEDCISFLESCQITDKTIQETIIQGSGGLPYYLDLMVDTFQLVSKKRIPCVDDFSNRPSEVLKRFLKYLDRTEKETLKILSVPRFWSEQLFTNLVTEFKTYYQPTAFDEFCHFSFIQEIDRSGLWSMHKLMKEGLYNDIPSPILERVHFFLLNYYTETLKKDNPDVELHIAFVEGLHHGEIILDEKEITDWISTHSPLLVNEGKWSTLIQEFERILDFKTEKKRLHAFVNHKLGELYALKGQYRLGEKYCIDAMKLYQKLQQSQEINSFFQEITDIQQILGDIYKHTNEYENAVHAFKSALTYLEQWSKDEPQKLKDIAIVLTRLGKIYKFMSQYEEAKQSYELALEKCLQIINGGFASSYIYAVLGEVHEKLGELEHDEVQNENTNISHFFQAIDAYNYALQDKSLENYLTVLVHKGLAHKRLAEAYPVNTHAKEKLQSFNQSISFYNEVIQYAPDYVDGYERRGHAATDLLELNVELGNDEEALKNFDLAVNSFEKAIELSEKQGSSRNRLGSAYRSLGKLYRKQKNYALAIEAFETALKKSDEVLLYTPQYIYTHNSRGKTYMEMGNCYRDMGNTTSANTSFIKAIECFNKTLETSPNSRTALAYIEKLNQLIKIFKFGHSDSPNFVDNQ
ncbi:tetratricopeptide repeat protein [Fredinandcohnia sp. FSL W7-1320]|uniref:tetratricopeptide repeat protein n=1 Tax=Fredinandcohnia sp. FSL W7-1320 TaxID=2954540 RepID=UPI0030FD47A2